MLLHRVVLADQLEPVAIARRILMSRKIACVEHDVPLESGRVFDKSLGLTDHIGKTFTTASNICRNVRAARCPHTKFARRFFLALKT